MRILFCSSEIYPYVKTGGLGDVTAALPAALTEAGADIRLFLPGYEKLIDNLQKPQTVIKFPVYFGATNVRILKGMLPEGVPAYVLDAPGFWNRSSAYVDENGQDWPDNHYRFAAFCRAATDLPEFDPSWHADIIHGNDWQCGLMAPYVKLKQPAQPKTIMTIHNIAYQGLFQPHLLPVIGLPGSMFTIEGAEFYNKIGYLKAGLAYSDHITTVSPTYAREIQDSDQGCGLQGFLKMRSEKITGILNGIDASIWNPATDRDIAQKYTAETLTNRAKNKKHILKQFNLPKDSSGPLFAVISRLGHQKGFDILLEAMPALLAGGGSLILLGSGDKTLEDAFTKLAEDHPKQVSVNIGYNEILAHGMQAGADVIVMPSRSEPCGLVQLYAMRYGALPFVHKTGGLADTVNDISGPDPTGFVFDRADAISLTEKLKDVFDAYKNRAVWEQMQLRGMRKDYSWKAPADEYMKLYNRLLA